MVAYKVKEVKGMMEYDKKHLFFCYDRSLHIRLKKSNVKFIVTAISNDNKRFWLYWRTEEVKEIIKQNSI